MKIFLSFYTLVISFVSYSQNLDYNNSYESINICTAIQGNNFASERAADSALDDILNVIGASKRFVLQECSNINNAVALTMIGVYIRNFLGYSIRLDIFNIDRNTLLCQYYPNSMTILTGCVRVESHGGSLCNNAHSVRSQITSR